MSRRVVADARCESRVPWPGAVGSPRVRRQRSTGMGSINENQPETNREDLRGREAVEKIRELVGKAKNCFFCTSAPAGETGGARPMKVRGGDDDGELWV